jgi:hypothetical protein
MNTIKAVALLLLVAASLQTYTVSDVRQFPISSAGVGNNIYAKHKIHRSPDGSKYIMGTFQSSFTFNNVTYNPSSSNYDAFIIKYKPDGSPDFVKTIPFGTSNLPYINGDVASDGSLYYGSYGSAAFTLDGISVPASLCAVLHLNAAGSLLWARTSNNMYFSGLGATSDNGVTFMGSSYSNITMNDGTLIIPVTNGIQEAVTVRYSSTGVYQWSYRRLACIGGGNYYPVS